MVIEDFGFKKRIKHPPPDPMNILLSLAYTMLFNNVYAFVEAAGLDPYCGFFHDLKYGHPALVSDLMEEFRAPVADSMVIGLINRKQITEKHFADEEGKIIFNKEGLAIFFEQYRKKINEKFTYKGLKLDFLQIIERQVWHFMRYLKGEDEHYEGYVHR
jgi:CRISPR-associated protein Cas1